MKKILIFLLCIVSLFSFAACGNDKNSDSLPDFKDCEIGYQLEVYPKVAFDYKLDDGTIVHISSITATLTEKNEINEGDEVSGGFYRYEITINATGNTSSHLSGKTIRIYYTFPNSESNFSGTINADGSFNISRKLLYVSVNCTIGFSDCEIV